MSFLEKPSINVKKILKQEEYYDRNIKWIENDVKKINKTLHKMNKAMSMKDKTISRLTKEIVKYRNKLRVALFKHPKEVSKIKKVMVKAEKERMKLIFSRRDYYLNKHKNLAKIYVDMVELKNDIRKKGEISEQAADLLHDYIRSVPK